MSKTITSVLRPLLEQTGLPWEIRQGTKHNKVFISGQLVTVFPGPDRQNSNVRAQRNVEAAIKRFARGAPC